MATNGRRTTGERLAVIEDQLTTNASTSIRVENKIDKFIDKSEKEFVTKDEFRPVKSLTFGAAGLMLTLLLTAIVGIVVIFSNNSNNNRKNSSVPNSTTQQQAQPVVQQPVTK